MFTKKNFNNFNYEFLNNTIYYHDVNKRVYVCTYTRISK